MTRLALIPALSTLVAHPAIANDTGHLQPFKAAIRAQYDVEIGTHGAWRLEND